MQTPDVALHNLQLRAGNLDNERLSKERASDWIQLLWGTRHEIMFPGLDSGGNAAGWLLERLLRHSESVLVPIYGNGGEALADICEKLGADVVTVERERGNVFQQDALIAELRRRKPSMLIVAHGEIATSQLQPLDELGRACRELDILFMVDVAATSGIVPINADDWHADAIATGPTTYLTGSAILQAIAYNDSIKARLRGDFEPSQGDREHPILPFDFRRILDAVAYRVGRPIGEEEDLVESFERRKRNDEALRAGLRALGLTLHGKQESRLPSAQCIEIPEGLDADSLRQRLQGEFDIPCHAWRTSTSKPALLAIEIEAARIQNLEAAVGWLEKIGKAFEEEGYDSRADEAAAAAIQVYGQQADST